MDPNAYGKTKDFTGVAGAQYSYKFSRLLFMPSQLTIGMEYNYDKLHDISLGYNYQTNQSVHTLLEHTFRTNGKTRIGACWQEYVWISTIL